MRIISIIFVLYFTSFSQDKITLEDAWQIAAENNYTLQQLKITEKQLKQELNIQKSYYYPVINFSGNYLYQSKLASIELPPQIGFGPIEAGVNNQYDLALNINQEIFSGFRRQNLIKSAQQQYEINNLQYDITTNSILNTIGKLFYNMQLNILQRDVVDQSIKRIDDQLILMYNMLQAEQITAFDTVEIANKKLQLKNTFYALQDMYQTMQSQLKKLLNSDELPGIKRLDNADIRFIDYDLQALKNLARRQRAEIEQLDKNKIALYYQKSALQSGYFPKIFAFGSYHYGKPGVNFFQHEWMDYYKAGITMQWELWNGFRDKSKIQKTKLELQKFDIKKEQLVREIDNQVEEAYYNFSGIQRQIKLHRKLVAQEKERFRITQQLYQQQQTTLIELNNAESALTAAQLQLQKYYVQWFERKMYIDFITGSKMMNNQEV